MTEIEKWAVRRACRALPRYVPYTPRRDHALLLRVGRDPVLQPPHVRRAMLERARQIRLSFPPLP